MTKFKESQEVNKNDINKTNMAHKSSMTAKINQIHLSNKYISNKWPRYYSAQDNLIDMEIIYVGGYE